VDGRTLLLVFLYARGKTGRDNEPVPTLTHLHKEIFILTRKGIFKDVGSQLNFIPLYYGPFSPLLNDICDELLDSGDIRFERDIQLTPDGFKKAAQLYKNLNENERIEIIKTKEEFNRMKLDELLDHVYSLYPKFTTKSALKEGVVDEYFAKFCKENDITEDYVINSALRIRYGNEKSGS